MSINTHLKYCSLTLGICNLFARAVRSAQAQVPHATDGSHSAAQTEAAHGPSDYREFIHEPPTRSKLQC